jgi:uncharacterized circularly permuted ATP-grasp superfamily protein/uncharacterized alpha-E superfamily protein
MPAGNATPDCVASEPYDELYDSKGALRSQWQRYFGCLDVLGADEAKARWTKVKQILLETGASYTAHDAPGSERPWRLSPVPLLVAPNDWRYLCRGIAQRARLLSALISDLYGPQRTLMEGELPCELVYDNPRFLRSLHGMGSPRSNWLPLYGVDLVRGPNGAFHVVEDWTQSPAGMGYALENRVVVAQALPDLLRQCNVERLGPFFRLLGDRLRASAPHNRDAPRVGLLTPGPFSATYHEQAYLAKYMGLLLVQGEDLTVRNDRVFLKTLGGLLPIDVLLRRIFDDYCDPLELRAESQLGVPGIVQAVRSGNVAMLNPLGTGLLETPALAAYLGKLCNKLIHEDLIIESVPTYYCGDPSQLEVVLSEFDDMVLRPTLSAERVDSTFVHQLSTQERNELERQVRASPRNYTAQRVSPASRTPVIADGQLRSRAVMLRCFASAAQPNDYQVMPGGLALVATREDEITVSLGRGARSKDVWIVSDEDVQDGLIVPPSNPPIELSRGGGDLQSRVADNLYWLGRYTERAEAIGRLTRVIGVRALESPRAFDLCNTDELNRLLAALRMQTQFSYAGAASADPIVGQLAFEREFLAAVTDGNCAGSVVTALRSALRVSRVVRDRISHDTWRVLSSLDDLLDRLSRIQGENSISLSVDTLNDMVVALAAFSGLATESMTRGYAWRFLDMGRRLERAVNLVMLLRATLVEVSAREAAVIDAVLDVADSGMTYRRRYPASIQAAPAVDLLLADDSNPRGLIFQLRTLQEHVSALPSMVAPGVRSVQQRLILIATSQVELSDINDLCRVETTKNRREQLEGLLLQVGSALPKLSDSLTETYLYHADVARHLHHSDNKGDLQAATGSSP